MKFYKKVDIFTLCFQGKPVFTRRIVFYRVVFKFTVAFAFLMVFTSWRHHISRSSANRLNTGWFALFSCDVVAYGGADWLKRRRKSSKNWFQVFRFIFSKIPISRIQTIPESRQRYYRHQLHKVRISSPRIKILWTIVATVGKNGKYSQFVVRISYRLPSSDNRSFGAKFK